jgi:hypothetical protein
MKISQEYSGNLHVYLFMSVIISHSVLLVMRNVSAESVDKRKTHFVLNNFHL